MPAISKEPPKGPDASSFVAPHQRYQYKPFTGSSHWWALSRATRLPSSTRVLDIGCGSGALGRELGARGWTNLSAVEIDAATRLHVKDLYQRVEPSIEPYRGQTFDLLLLLDVIEHMSEPEEFLRQAATLLAPGGLMLVSVPNIAHWSIRLSILFGFFDYTERGILDRTHLQFFTTHRMARLPRQVPALELVEQSGSISPAEFVLPKAITDTSLFEWGRRVRRWGAHHFSGLCAFQLLAVLRKQP